MNDAHDARRFFVKIVANGEFQERHVNEAVTLRDADALAKFRDGLRSIAPTPQTRKRRHARIVPPCYDPFLHQLQKLAFTHDRIGQVETREFDLPRMVNGELIEEPIVERPVVFVFKGTERMGYMFD